MTIAHVSLLVLVFALIHPGESRERFKSDDDVRADPNWSLVSGSLTQVDVSPDDIVWGVNDGNIFIQNGSEWSKVDGSLTHVTVGEAGVWGVNINGGIYYREGVTLSNPAGSSWENIPGALVQIDSGPPGIVCGVDRRGKLYARTGISSSTPFGTGWVVVRFGMIYVSCGVYGCWGTDRNKAIWFRNGVNPKDVGERNWDRISGSLAQLEVDREGKVYGVTHLGQLFVREGVSYGKPSGSSWRYIPNREFVHVSAGYSKIVALDATGAIYDFRGEWTKISGSLMQIDHGLSMAVWGVSTAEEIFRLLPGNSWQQIGGSLKHVSTGEAGIWGVDRNDEIYYRMGVNESNLNGSSWQPIPGKLKQIDSGPAGIVYGVKADDTIYCRKGIENDQPFGTSWEQVTSNGGLKYVSCGVLGCWGVNSDDVIYYRSGISRENCVGTEWHKVGEKRLRQIEVGAAGDVYGINSAGEVWRRTGISELRPMGSDWEKILEYGSHITTGLTGQYLLSDGEIHHSSGCPQRSP